MKTPASLVALTLLCGCFDDSVGGGTGSPDNTSSSDGNSDDGSTSTSSPATTSEHPSTSSSSDVSTGTTSRGETDSNDNADGSSGEAPQDSCWGAKSQWTTRELDLADLAAENPQALVLSPDGLTLWFAAGPDEARVAYESSRPSLGEPFGAGAPVSGWPPSPSIAQPRLAHEVGKAIARVGGGLWASLLEGNTWGMLQPVEFPGLEGALSDPSLSSDGETLLFAHHELFEQTQQMIWVPYIAQWSELAAPPADATRLELPTFEREHAQLCPTISPDGRHLLLGGSYPETWATGIQGDLDIFAADATGTGWTAPERIPALSSGELHACPTSMTADGCTVLIRHFDDPFTGATFVLGQRDPS